MFPIILIAIAVLILAFVIIVAMQPAEMRISRSATMNAPASVVFDQVNTLRNWKPWSPWAKLDPNSTETHAGPPSGPGSSMTWSGNKQVGEGTITILESVPDQRVRYRLDFVRPFKATNESEFVLSPEGTTTGVHWTMMCKRNFVFKAFGLFMNMDKMVGNDFEKGLASMKAIVEQRG